MHSEHIEFLVPTTLRRYTDGEGSLRISSGTVGQALNEIRSGYSLLADQILDRDGQPKPFVRIYCNADDIRHIDGMATAIKPGDSLSIMVAVAGG